MPTAVLLLAAALRLWALSRPDELVFDEIYYVRDAVSQLAHGFPTTWPGDDVQFHGDAVREFSDHASAIAHPPLGKWLIGLGILLFGADSAWGWRIASAAAGVATVGVTMRIGWLLSRRLWVACLSGLLLAIDGVHVVLSRVGLLDGFLTLLVALGAWFIWHDQAGTARQISPGTRILRGTDASRRVDPVFGGAPAPGPGSALGLVLWRRPWLLAAGLAFGAAAAVKWSGLYPLAAFLLLITARDLILRWRTVQRPVLGSLRQAVVTAAIALPAALLAYLASWIGWILHPNAQDRSPGEPWWVSLWSWHAHSLSWHTTLTASHPYQALPLGWPISLRPTLMYWEFTEQGPGCPWSGGCVAEISPIPNPLVTWSGVLALLLLCWIIGRTLWRAARLRGSGARGVRAFLQPGIWAVAFVLVGYLSGWLPWVLTLSRSAVFQFYSVVLTPFAALALALVIGSFGARIPARPGDGATSGVLGLAGIRLAPWPESVLGRRIAIAIFVIAAIVLAVLFFPLWSGMPVARWFWLLHMWLPGWH